MAWTQADLDAVEAAIASGVEEVRFADRSVRYRTIGDLQKARQEIKNALSLAGPLPVRQVRIRTNKGFSGGPLTGGYSSGNY